MKSVRVRLLIYGDVIGVGFRYWMVGEARKLYLKGWVKNLPDCVETLLEGPQEKINKMIDLCHEGPPTAYVKSVDAQREEYTGEFSNFEIKY